MFGGTSLSENCDLPRRWQTLTQELQISAGIKHPDVIPLIISGESNDLRLDLIFLQSATFFCVSLWMNLRETRWVQFLFHPEGFQFQTRSVYNLGFVSAVSWLPLCHPNWLLVENLSFSRCLFSVMLCEIFRWLGRRWRQIAAKWLPKPAMRRKRPLWHHK